MKKIACALAGLFAVTAVAGAPRLDDSLPQLNAAVADLLKPFQTSASSASVEFQTLTTDAINVLTTRVVGGYQRVGKVQTMTVRLAGLTFDYANGQPVATISGDMAFNLSRVFQADMINSLVDSAEGMVEDIASNYTKAYGEAAHVKGTMIEKTKDASGNYVSFRASVEFGVDMSKLPSDKKSEDIPLLNGTMFFNVDLHKGIALNGTVNLNPAYKGFHGQGATLKMAIEKLLNRDADAGKLITTYVQKIDKMAASLVDAKVSE